MNRVYLYLSLFVFGFYVNNELFTAPYALSELYSVLSSLEDSYRFSSYDALLHPIKNNVLKDKIKKGLEKTQSFTTKEQVLVRYLIGILLENEAFIKLLSRGGLNPNLNYEKGEYYLYADYSTDLVTRILLTVAIVRDIQKNWPKTEKIAIASLGGGRLLQDYMLIKALLFSGFHNISLYVIDDVDHTQHLKEILKGDVSLKSEINVEHYNNTYEFLYSGPKNTHVCYVVSPTGGAYVKDIKNIADKLKMGEINWVKVRETIKKQIVFYIPYNFNDSFAKSGDKSYFKAFIKQINYYLEKRSEDPFVYVFGVLAKLPNQYEFLVADDIMLNLYDLIKHSTIPNCLGYKALGENIASYYDVKTKPYWTLNYEIEGKLDGETIWYYDPDNKKLIELLQ